MTDVLLHYHYTKTCPYEVAAHAHTIGLAGLNSNLACFHQRQLFFGRLHRDASRLDEVGVVLRARCVTLLRFTGRPQLRSARSLQMPNSTISPSTRGTGSPASSPTRNLGPWHRGHRDSPKSTGPGSLGLARQHSWACRSPSTSTRRPSILAYFLTAPCRLPVKWDAARGVFWTFGWKFTAPLR